MGICHVWHINIPFYHHYTTILPPLYQHNTSIAPFALLVTVSGHGQDVVQPLGHLLPSTAEAQRKDGGAGRHLGLGHLGHLAGLSRPLMVISLRDLWTEIAPSIQLPPWLECAGSARQSCQRIYRLLKTLDFQIHYFVIQTTEVISWIRQRLADISEALGTVASRLTKLERLVYNLDSDLASAEAQLLWIPGRNVQPKRQPSKKQPRPSSAALGEKNETSMEIP